MTHSLSQNQRSGLAQRFRAMRGGSPAADAAVIIPFNAQAGLENLMPLLEDVARYSGPYDIEVLVVLNNYPAGETAPHATELEALGLTLACVPNVRRPGEAVAFSARIHGLRAAAPEHAILFDADCRIPDTTALFDWYIRQLKRGAKAAYTPVLYHDLGADLSIRARVMAHHLARWGKRTLFGIPTTRGGNYAVHSATMLQLYEQGFMADEMNVGPTIKSHGGKVVYSGARRLRVLTSGDRLRSGWRELSKYLVYRLRYNVNVLPVRADAASRTKRTHKHRREYALFTDERPANDEQPTGG